MPTSTHLSPDEIRSLFAQAMSQMYREEVPLYGTLMELVSTVNAATLARDPSLAARLQRSEIGRASCRERV